MTNLRDALVRKNLSKTDKYLLILAHQDHPTTNSRIKEIARENGWKDGTISAPASFLGKSAHAILLPDGWTLTGPGRIQLSKRDLITAAGVLTPVIQSLEKYVPELRNRDNAKFVEEAISCVRNGSYRSAIVLTWVGAIHLLYSHVLQNSLLDFNNEMRRRFSSKKAISTIDDLAQALKESEFLNILEHIGTITKAENKELGGCLERRNTAGHPNSHSFTEVTVGHHVETLVRSVYQKF